MREILGILAIAAGAMLLIAAALYGLDDRSTLTSPPEAVAESFARQIVAERYERAIPYLSSDLAERVPIDSLRAFGEEVKEMLHGEVLTVDGEPISQGDDTARAAARITSRDTTLTLIVPMKLEEGAWSVSQLKIQK